MVGQPGRARAEIDEHSWKLLSRSRPRFQELGSWDLMSW